MIKRAGNRELAGRDDAGREGPREGVALQGPTECRFGQSTAQVRSSSNIGRGLGYKDGNLGPTISLNHAPILSCGPAASIAGVLEQRIGVRGGGNGFDAADAKTTDDDDDDDDNGSGDGRRGEGRGYTRVALVAPLGGGCRYTLVIRSRLRCASFRRRRRRQRRGGVCFGELRNNQRDCLWE